MGGRWGVGREGLAVVLVMLGVLVFVVVIVVMGVVVLVLMLLVGVVCGVRWCGVDILCWWCWLVVIGT